MIPELVVDLIVFNMVFFTYSYFEAISMGVDFLKLDEADILFFLEQRYLCALFFALGVAMSLFFR